MAKIANLKDLEWTEGQGPDPYRVRRKHLTAETESCNLGASVYRLDPGAKACPAHYHFGNDEAVFVLSGNLTLLLDGVAHQMPAGSYVTLPAGTGQAHQLENRSESPVDYLCFSTMQKTDVVIYPDSSKVGLFGGMAPGGQESAKAIRRWVKDEAVDYWDGET